MKILFCGYRDWARSIYDILSKKYSQVHVLFSLVTSKEELQLFEPDQYDLVLFVGWSWIIEKKWIQTNKCLCIHPSPLPLYRGGSPIQHQIINGEKNSAVTLFLMDEGIDTGPILYFCPFSLEGELDNVFQKIIYSSIVCLSNLINYYLLNEKIPIGQPQDNSKATTYKRRKKEMSEITIGDINNNTAKELYDKIRALQDPYPNAFIKCGDGSILYITKAKI